MEDSGHTRFVLMHALRLQCWVHTKVCRFFTGANCCKVYFCENWRYEFGFCPANLAREYEFARQLKLQIRCTYPNDLNRFGFSLKSWLKYANQDRCLDK